MNETLPAVESECDVLFFSAGGQTYGTDPRDVLRVDRSQPHLRTALIAGAGIGVRALVVAGPGHEVAIPVDTVLGVRRTPRAQLRPVPAYLTVQHAELARELLGVLAPEDSAPIWILDLKRLSERATPPPARTDTSHGQNYRFG